MRKASILSGLMVTLLAVLFFGCTPQNAESTEGTSLPKSGPHIVHIVLDSLQVGYTALSVELTRLEENYTQAQENLTKEGESLQQLVNSLQNRAQQGKLSPKQIQSEQQTIARKEQELRQKQEIAMGSIQQEQLVLQDRFATQVREILETLKEENGYDYVLNQSQGSGVLVADPRNDITDLVVERLNALGPDAMTKEVE